MAVTKHVLPLCTGSSARTPMATVFLPKFGGAKYKANKGRLTFQAAWFARRKAEDDCPKLSADAERLHRWIFEDPVRADGTDEAKLACFRETRGLIEARLQLWLAETEEAEQTYEA